MRSLFLIAFFLLLGSCNLGPRYEAPPCPEIFSWKGVAAEGETPKVDNWWDIFADEELSRLELLAIEKNLDLHVALQRVASSRAVAGVIGSFRYPWADLKPQFNNVMELIELYGVPPGLFPKLKTITRVREQTYSLPAVFTYEVDLWGKYHGAYNSAKIYADSLDEAVAATLLSVTATVASNYFNLRQLDLQVALLKEEVELEKERVEMSRMRYGRGLVSLIELDGMQQDLANMEAELEETIRQRASFENALALLIGANASEWKIAVSPLNKEPPLIPPGLPSDLLLRRPDVAQAERAMASFHALIGVAYATYFPDIPLTTSLGALSPDLSQFLTWSSRLWQIGTNITQVLFNVGRNSSYVKGAWAKFEEAKALYQKAVLNAFSEVEDALSDVEQQRKQSLALQVVLEKAEHTAELSFLRWHQGITGRLDFLDAQKSAIDARRNWVNVVGPRYQSAIELVKAIGGTWEAMDPCGKQEESSSCEG
ncbi:MAG: efflux transporter outer membrane subunit [Verrucomicrobiota bacterium]|nr:efflux transporter outer membrane subunit [Verrucomicrobiota bacterium]